MAGFFGDGHEISSSITSGISFPNFHLLRDVRVRSRSVSENTLVRNVAT